MTYMKSIYATFLSVEICTLYIYDLLFHINVKDYRSVDILS